MGAILVSTKGQIVLPVAVRNALGIKPGMRVNVNVEGKKATLTLASAKNTIELADIQARLKYTGPTVPISAMRVTDYKS